MGKAMTAVELHETLSETLRDVRTGKIEVRTANSVGGLAGKILGTVAIQMKYAKMTGQIPQLAFLTLPMSGAKNGAGKK